MIHTSFCFELEAHLVHDNQHCYITNEVRFRVSLHSVIKLGLATQKLVFLRSVVSDLFRLQHNTTNRCKFDIFGYVHIVVQVNLLVVKGG